MTNGDAANGESTPVDEEKPIASFIQPSDNDVATVAEVSCYNYSIRLLFGI
jgi:hypothetical protein